MLIINLYQCPTMKNERQVLGGDLKTKGYGYFSIIIIIHVFDLYPFSIQTPKGRSESPLLKKSPALSSLVANKRGGRRLRIDLKKGEEDLASQPHAYCD